MKKLEEIKKKTNIKQTRLEINKKKEAIMANDLDILKKHFLNNLRIGILLTANELRKFCQKRKLIVKEKLIRRIRRFWKFSAMFENPRSQPKYMSASILKYGTLMCDIGFIPAYKTNNQGYSAFLAVKEIVSGAIGALEIKNKTTKELFQAIANIIAKGPFKQVHTLVWDQESAITSSKFRDLLQNEYGVKVFFLKSRSKAYLAELAVAYIKKRIAMKVEASGNKRWIGNILQNIIRHYNEQNVPGTKFKRGSITRKNTELFLRAKLKTKNPTLTFNASTLKPSSLRSSEWRDKLFKFQVGDEVLVLKKAKIYGNNEIDDSYVKKKSKINDDPTYRPTNKSVSKKGVFKDKSTLKGSYSRKSFTIAERTLKSSNQWFWTAVYKLEEREGFFYEA